MSTRPIDIAPEQLIDLKIMLIEHKKSPKNNYLYGVQKIVSVFESYTN